MIGNTYKSKRTGMVVTITDIKERTLVGIKILNSNCPVRWYDEENILDLYEPITDDVYKNNGELWSVSEIVKIKDIYFKSVTEEYVLPEVTFVAFFV